VLVIPATWKAETGGSQFETLSEKKKLKTKGMEMWLKW
jgi:hypothetical protein